MFFLLYAAEEETEPLIRVSYFHERVFKNNPAILIFPDAAKCQHFTIGEIDEADNKKKIVRLSSIPALHAILKDNNGFAPVLHEACVMVMIIYNNKLSVFEQWIFEKRPLKSNDHKKERFIFEFKSCVDYGNTAQRKAFNIFPASVLEIKVRCPKKNLRVKHEEAGTNEEKPSS